MTLIAPLPAGAYPDPVLLQSASVPSVCRCQEFGGAGAGSRAAALSSQKRWMPVAFALPNHSTDTTGEAPSRWT